MGEQDYPYSEVLTLRRKVERLKVALDAARDDNGAALDLIERHGRDEGMAAAAEVWAGWATQSGAEHTPQITGCPTSG